MKKLFEYISLFAFAIFSFYYTDRIVEMVNKNDPLVDEINSYAVNANYTCVEGYEKSDGIVLGVSGLLVDEKASYSNMKGFGFNENLIEFKKDECKVVKEDNLDKYIVKGNEVKNAISILVMVNDGSLIKSFADIAKEKRIEIDFVMSGSMLETYKSYFSENDHSIMYTGNDEIDLEKFKAIMRELDVDDFYCISNGFFDIKEMCSKEKINSVKSEFIYNKDILLNTKRNLDKGNIYIYKENRNNLEEFASVINHIKGKGINILSLEELLD